MFRLVCYTFLALQSYALLDRVGLHSLAIARFREELRLGERRRQEETQNVKQNIRQKKFLATHKGARNSIQAHDEACVEASCAGVPEQCMEEPGSRKKKFGWKHPAGAMQSETNKVQRNYDNIKEACGEAAAIGYLDAHDALTTEPPIWEKRVAHKYPNKYEEKKTEEMQNKAERDAAKQNAAAQQAAAAGGSYGGASTGYSDDDCEEGYYICEENGQIFCCPYDDPYSTGAAVDDTYSGSMPNSPSVDTEYGAPDGLGDRAANAGSRAASAAGSLEAPQATRSTSVSSSTNVSRDPVTQGESTNDGGVDDTDSEKEENPLVKNLPYIAGGAVIVLLLIIVAVKVGGGGKKNPPPKRSAKKGKKGGKKTKRTRGVSN